MKTDKIIEYVARCYNLKPENLKIKSKFPYLTEARYVAIYLLLKKFKKKVKEIELALDTNYHNIWRSVRIVTKKMADRDFINYLNQIAEDIKYRTRPTVNFLEKDLDTFKKTCKKVDNCLVAEKMFIKSRGLAVKYNVSMANQLYFLLTTGKYPTSDIYHKMKKTCKTKNCVVHWTANIGDELVSPNLPFEESDEYSPEEKFFFGVIESALKEDDERYFKSGLFSLDLYELGVEHGKKIYKRLKKDHPRLAKLAEIGHNKIEKLLKMEAEKWTK